MSLSEVNFGYVAKQLPEVLGDYASSNPRPISEDELKRLQAAGVLKAGEGQAVPGYEVVSDTQSVRDFLDVAEKLRAEYKKLITAKAELDRAYKEGDFLQVEKLSAKIEETESKISEFTDLTKSKYANLNEIDKEANVVKNNTVTKIEDQAKKEAEGLKEKEDKRQGAMDLKQYEALLKQQQQLEIAAYTDAKKSQTVVGSRNRQAYADRAMFEAEQLEEVKQQVESAKMNGMVNSKAFREGYTGVEDKIAVLKEKGILNANIATKGQDNLWGVFGQQLQNTFTRFVNYTGVLKLISSIKQGITTVVNMAKQLDKSMTDLRIVTGMSGDEARSTMKKYGELANGLAATTTEVATSGNEWLRQGYDMAEVSDLITSTMYLSRLGMISAEEATKDLTSAMKGFNIEASNSMSIVDKFTNLDVHAATTAGEIATALSQFANTANIAGVGIDEAAAMATTIMDISQVSGSTAGNALKTIISRYGNVKSGAFVSMSTDDSEENGQNLNDVEKVLNKIGISIRDTKNEFRDFDDVLEDLGKV